MKAKLIGYTQPSKEMLELENISDIISYCARVSNPSNQMNLSTSDGLIKYLVRNSHWSPFEIASITIEIETTRDIARQILRHRSFTFQEFCLSGDTEVYFSTPANIRKGSYNPSVKVKISDLYDQWENGAKPINNDLRIPLQDRIKQRHIKIFDENSGKLGTAHIKNVFKTGIKDLYKITLADGKEIKTTKEHKFLTKNGFCDLQEIVGLEMKNERALMTKQKPIIAVNGEINYRNKEWLYEKKMESIANGKGIKYIAECSGMKSVTISKWLRRNNLQYTKSEVDSYTKPWNFEKHAYNTKPLNKLKDFVNWQGTRKENAYVPKWVEIKKIEYIGKDETYDLEIDHVSHNYIANGIIVHNSQRYADPQDMHNSFIIREARLQDNKNRQNSLEIEDSEENRELKKLWEEYQASIIKHSQDVYNWAVNSGIAKEVARSVLPEGLTKSRMYMQGSVRSWIHYLDLRTGHGTQKEHMELAILIAKAISEIFPIDKYIGD